MNTDNAIEVFNHIVLAVRVYATEPTPESIATALDMTHVDVYAALQTLEEWGWVAADYAGIRITRVTEVQHDPDYRKRVTRQADRIESKRRVRRTTRDWNAQIRQQIRPYKW